MLMHSTIAASESSFNFYSPEPREYPIRMIDEIQEQKHIECMIEGYSLRKSAEKLHGEVTHVTLFYWRHKILAALKQIPTKAFKGIVEMDETYLLFSEKGKRNIFERKPCKCGGKAKNRGISNDQICVLVARDRQKMT